MKRERNVKKRKTEEEQELENSMLSIIQEMREINPEISEDVILNPSPSHTLATVANVLVKQIAQLKSEVEYLKNVVENSKKTSRLEEVE